MRQSSEASGPARQPPSFTSGVCISDVPTGYVLTGASFITLAATLQVVPTIPVAGMALILGVDRFMSEIRATTNLLGNGLATLVVSRWEGELDTARLKAKLEGRELPLLPPPAARKRETVGAAD